MTGKGSNRKAIKLDDKQKEYKKIGKRLIQLRKAAGFRGSLRFALEIDMHPAQYARYEAGSDLKISSLMRVLSFHNLTLQEFFAGIE
jgi:transcriptional regulator with XRE-family HTH domain